MIEFIKSDPVIIIGTASVIFIWFVMFIIFAIKITMVLRDKSRRDDDEDYE